MTEEEFIKHSCTRKKRFSAYSHAEKFLTKHKKRGIIISHTTNIYSCGYCGGYHIGHRKEK